MNAVILAAGQGTRLQPLTRNKPKCLVRVAGRPIIDHMARALLDNGITRLVVVAGYYAESVSEWAKTLSDPRLIILGNKEYSHTNNMFSLHLSRPFLAGEPFILANGDVVIQDRVIQELLADQRPNLIVSEPGAWNEESMKTTLGPEGFFSDISKDIAPKAAYGLSCDIYKLSAESGETLLAKCAEYVVEKQSRSEWTEVALQELMQSGRLKLEPHDIESAAWLEIDTPDDLLRADALFGQLSPRLPGIKAVFSDLDGTLFLGDKAIPGAAEALARIRRRNISVFFVSNNSSGSHEDYVQRLEGLGIPATPDEIILSTDGLLEYLISRGITQTWTIGTNALCTILKKRGIKTDSRKPDYVVLGYDTELTYEKLRRGAIFLNKEVPLLATHPDLVCPTPEGPIPDIGAILKILTSTTGVTPERVFGKPQPEMILPVLNRLGITAAEAVIVGDRLYTDIKMAKSTGCRSALVLSGETDRETVENHFPFPDLIVPNFASLG